MNQMQPRFRRAAGIQSFFFGGAASAFCQHRPPNPHPVLGGSSHCLVFRACKDKNQRSEDAKTRVGMRKSQESLITSHELFQVQFFACFVRGTGAYTLAAQPTKPGSRCPK